MRIFSQNIINYGIPIPKNSILRINLAWINSIEELEIILQKNNNSDIPCMFLTPSGLSIFGTNDTCFGIFSINFSMF